MNLKIKTMAENRAISKGEVKKFEDIQKDNFEKPKIKAIALGIDDVEVYEEYREN